MTVGDQDPELDDELRLRLQVRLAGAVDQLADLAHRLVDRKVLELLVLDQAEQEADRADDQADRQDVPAGHAQELHLVEVGEHELRFAVRARGGAGAAAAFGKP